MNTSDRDKGGVVSSPASRGARVDPTVAAPELRAFDTSQDVVVVGAGIIGLAVARELLRRGRRVVVIDDGRAGQATTASAGMLAPAAESDIELPGLCAYRRWNHSLYPEWIAALERESGVACGLRTEGTLLVALDRDHRAELQRLRGILEDQGFRPQPLTAHEVAEAEPGLSPRVVEGLRLPDDHWVESRAVLRALRGAVESQGGIVLAPVRVTRVTPQAGVVVQHGAAATSPAAAEPHEFQAQAVVVAAGSWSNIDLGMPCEHLPVRPVKGEVVRVEAPGLLRGVVRTPDIYLVPHADGTLVIGASVEEQGFDVRPALGPTFDLLRHAWRALPGLADVAIRELSVGFRPTSRDHLPILGQLGTSRIYVATGHYRNGILQAPGTARVLADLVCDGRRSEWLDAFGPERLGELTEVTS